jgi:hypothetical protein
MGLGDFAEDIAQDVVVTYLEQPGKPQTIQQATIDAVRKIFRDGRSKTFLIGQALEHHSQLSDSCASLEQPQVPPDVVIDCHYLLSRLSIEDENFMRMRFFNDDLLKDIGKMFGCTEAWASYKLKDLLANLAEKAKDDE